jgi:hypothetical protein
MSLRAMGVLLIAITIQTDAYGQTPDAGSKRGASVSAENPTGTPAGKPLGPLPILEAIVEPARDAAGDERYNRLLEEIVANRYGATLEGALGLDEIQTGWTARAREQLEQISAQWTQKQFEPVLTTVRTRGRERMRKDSGLPEEWLSFALLKPAPTDATWRALTDWLFALRVLRTQASPAAGRAVVAEAAHWLPLMRPELNRAVLGLGHQAVPALLEARRHDAAIVRDWAEQRLDELGRVAPGEAVATQDPALLAEILRVYGRTRDLSAFRVLLGFVSHEQPEVRRAARGAVTAFGGAGLWQLRDEYQNLSGKKPPKSMNWEQLWREILTLTDRQKQREFEGLLDEGLKAAAAGDRKAALEQFERVRTAAPGLPRLAETLSHYVLEARTLRESAPAEALRLYRIAGYIAKDLELKESGSTTWTLQEVYAAGDAIVAEQGDVTGIPERHVAQRALAILPEDEGAKRVLKGIEKTERANQGSWLRRRWREDNGVFLGIALIAAAVTGSVAFLGSRLWRTRRDKH